MNHLSGRAWSRRFAGAWLAVGAAIWAAGCRPGSPETPPGAESPPAQAPAGEAAPEEAPPAPAAPAEGSAQPQPAPPPAEAAPSAQQEGEPAAPSPPPAEPVGPAAEPQEKPAPEEAAPGGQTRPPQASGPPVWFEPPRQLQEPRVVMSEAHWASCRVKPGEAFPPLRLPDVNNQLVSLADVRGARLTVVVFWSTQQPYSLEQFLRLEREVNVPYWDRGVRVVAINVGDSAETVRALLEQAEATFPCLRDADGAALEQVSEGPPPRTFLLGPDGNLLWLDIEYSEPMRRELRNAIEYYLRAS